MRKHSTLPTIDIPVEDNCIVVTLLNTRSYNKYKDDIKSDHTLMKTDVLSLTETQIELNSNCETRLDSFNLIANNSMDRFSSLLVVHRGTIEIFDVMKIPGAMLFKMLKRK